MTTVSYHVLDVYSGEHHITKREFRWRLLAWLNVVIYNMTPRALLLSVTWAEVSK